MHHRLLSWRSTRNSIFSANPFSASTRKYAFVIQSNDTLQQKTLDTLVAGLTRLTASFPWVAGQVVNEGASEGNTGVFKIKPLDAIPRLRVRDLGNDPSIPTMETLRKGNFPMRLLDESLVAPRNTIPGSSGEALSETSPVFLVQATYVQGGLLLNFNGHHGSMDMIGQGQIIDLLDKACRNEPFTSEELSSGNLPRRGRIPFLDDAYDPVPDLVQQIVRPGPPPSFAKSSWACFAFGATELAALKSEAMKAIKSGFVSTDDALTALIWQSTTKARLTRLDPTSQSTLGRAVDVRRYLDVPKTYPGLVQNMAYHTAGVRDLVDKPLGAIAQELRSAVDPKTTKLGHNSRALATFMDRTADKTVISFSATMNLSSDIMISSWAKIDCYDLDFNMGLGKPEAVRRPQFIPFESLMYLLPKKGDGEIGVALCLRDADMEGLKADDEFRKYGKYVG